MKTIFSTNLAPDQLDLLILHCQNQYDIAAIEHFIHNPHPTPLDDTQRLNYLLETRNKLKAIINAIQDYENNHTEDRTMDSNLGCD